MRRERRRPMHYHAHTLHDGTVLAAYPVRKPMPKTIKRDNLKIDDDGVCQEWSDSGKQLSDVRNETRTRFQDIIAVNLNTRRAIREIARPHLAALQQEMKALHDQLNRIEQLLTSRPGG